VKTVQVPRRFVTHSWGGTETVVLQTSKRLIAMGHPTEILCPDALAKSRNEVIDGVNVRRYSYFYPYFGLSTEAKSRLDEKGGNMFSFPLMKALKQEPGLNLIHLHTGNRVGGIGRYVAEKRGIPYVISLHGGLNDVPTEEAAAWTEPTKGAYEWGKLLGAWVGSRKVMQEAAAILCVGKAEQEVTSKKYPNTRVLYLPNGVSSARFASGDGAAFRSRYNLPPAAHIIGSIGRIDPQKNQLFLIQALPQILQIRQDAHLLCVGHVTNPPYHEKLKAEITKLGLENHVTLIPGLDAGGASLADAYHAIDTFVLPSIHEPFGIVILEAWAAGKPVIAARVGGIPSFVEDGSNGLLYEPGSEQAFLKAFAGLMQSNDLQLKIANTGKQTAVTQYDWDVVTEMLLKIYVESIEMHQKKGR
jgi:glycosyltransferase involved in cell wall biosynthesis